MTRVIRTLLGAIDPTEAGAVDSHDHLFLTAAVLRGEELDDEEAASAELGRFSAAGGGTIVQWTPRGLRRRLPVLARLSRSTGVHIVAATGRHRMAIYPPDSSDQTLTTDQLATEFIGDIEERGCGLIKVGVGFESITAYEMVSLEAAAVAHRETGVPIAVHLEEGSAAGLVLDALLDRGVGPESIVLGHLGRNVDIAPVIEAARSGAWLCLDTSSPRHPIESRALARLCSTLVDHGHLAQLLIGADTTAASARAHPLAFGPTALLRRQVPELREVLGADTVSRIVFDNPSRAWAVKA